jgi:hypothetical protein
VTPIAPPPAPGPDASASEIAAWEREMSAYRAHAAMLHAQAQADTALAMDRAAAAQEALTLGLNAPPAAARFDPVTTAVQVAAELAAHTPMTPDQIAKRARDVAVQLGQEFPA